MLAKLEQRAKEGDGAWVDGEGYRRAVAEHEAAFRKELALQQGRGELAAGGGEAIYDGEL